jgi:hypothetical protein
VRISACASSRPQTIRQTQTFVFDRDQVHARATFRGRVVGGTGRYSDARGTVSGGGPVIDGVAAWRVTMRLA